MALVGRLVDQTEVGKAGMVPECVFFGISGTPNRPTVVPAGISETICLLAGPKQPGGCRLAFEESSQESLRQRFEALDGPDDVMKPVFLLANVFHETGRLDT